MVWKIDDIELPIEPELIQKSILRSPQTQSLQFDFPSVSDTSMQSFSLKIKGLIWDEVKAKQLWELTKDAEAEIINIQVEDDTDHDWVAGTYAAGKSFIKRDKPLYTADDSPVWSYDITFTQYAEAGIQGPGEEGEPEETEPGVGPAGWEDTLDDYTYNTWTWFTQLLI